MRETKTVEPTESVRRRIRICYGRELDELPVKSRFEHAAKVAMDSVPKLSSEDKKSFGYLGCTGIFLTARKKDPPHEKVSTLVHLHPDALLGDSLWRDPLVLARIAAEKEKYGISYLESVLKEHLTKHKLALPVARDALKSIKSHIDPASIDIVLFGGSIANKEDTLDGDTPKAYQHIMGVWLKILNDIFGTKPSDVLIIGPSYCVRDVFFENDTAKAFIIPKCGYYKDSPKEEEESIRVFTGDQLGKVMGSL